MERPKHVMGPWPKFVIERVDFWRKSINCRCRTPYWRCYQGPKTSSKNFHKDTMSEKEILDFGSSPKRPLRIDIKRTLADETLYSVQFFTVTRIKRYSWKGICFWILGELDLSTPNFQVIKGGNRRCSVKMQQSSP